MAVQVKSEKLDIEETATVDPQPQRSSEVNIKKESGCGEGDRKDAVKQPPPKIHFECGDCGLTEEADFYGRKPPFCRSVVFHEDSYICRDPFSPQGSNSANFLLLGSKCAVCGTMTCQDCSVFYNIRFCGRCAKSAQQSLPQQLKITKGNKD